MTAFTGVGPLVRFVLRRDRVYLPVWVLAIVGLTYASVAAVRRTYNTPVEIASYAINVGGSPASIAMAGPPFALNEVGGILIYETGMTAMLGVALMAVFMVVRHTRTEEDSGRVELLGSTVVSPHAVITAAVLVGSVASVLVGAGVTASFLAEQQPVEESVLYGAAIAALGVVFTGVAACAAQLASHGRGAIGLSLGALGVVFGLRAIGDVGESFWSWLSPFGWSQQVAVYEDNRWWPLGLSLALTAVLLAATVALEGRRDLGAGILPARPGPAEASRLLSSPLGLSWRLQRGAVLGWSVGLLALGMLFGSFSESIENMVEDNPQLKDYFAQSGGNIVDAFFATALLLMALTGSGFAVSSTLRMRGEETSGRLEPVLATAVTRHRWMFSNLLVTLVGTAVVVGVGGLGVGISYAVTSGRAGEVGRMTAYSLAYLPAVLALSALAVLLIGWFPRAVGVAWGALAVYFVVGYLGGLLQVPDWLRDLSPFSHTPAVPDEALTFAPLAVLTLLVVAGVVIGYAGFRRRDVIPA